jgi:mono/diheme cytochrome c family protein
MRIAIRGAAPLGWAWLLALVAGCGQSDPAHFRLNVVELRDLTPAQQQQAANLLTAVFGTPDQPVVLQNTGTGLEEVLSQARLERAAGPVSSDQFGRRVGLYREHCAYCHGTTGDGLGPTAATLNPYPRDYRLGKFKFKSTLGPARPTDDDLARVIRDGIPGTAMPSFNLLEADEIAALVDYVKYLSIRGQAESELARLVANDLTFRDALPTTREKVFDELLSPIVTSWKEAPTKVIQPEEKPPLPADPQQAAAAHAANVAAGRELFYAKANCIKCHGDSAQGDGQNTDYDDWSKPLVDAHKSLTASLEGAAERRAAVEAEIAKIKADRSLSEEDRKTQLEDQQYELDELARLPAKLAAVNASLPPRTINPRNLRQGVYRGGRRPLDIYRRIFSGILGTPMPGAGAGGTPTPGTETTQLTSAEIWQLVDYVRALPGEPISRSARPAATLTPAKAGL